MSKRLTTKEFIEKAKEVYGDLYDYSLTFYETAIKPIKIICKIHGEFELNPNKHLSGGRGCQECSFESRAKKAKQNFSPIDKNFGIENFLKKAKIIHENTYDYSLVEYKNSRTKVKIICPNHGIFEQSPNHHIQKMGCPICSKDKRLLNVDEFLERAHVIHNNLYDYSSMEYIGFHTKIKIICPEHGIFEQTPANHLQEHGCKYCSYDSSSSKEELEVLNWVKEVYNGKIITNDRELLNGKELDIYIPDLKFAIEYNGLYWHTEFKVGKTFHYEKTIECGKMGVSLFHLYSDDWRDKKDIIKSMIKNRLNLIKNKIFARKCVIKQIDKTLGKDFFNRNHLSGDVASTKYYGLFYNQELVSCLSLRTPFHKKYEGYIEIARFATKLDTIVVGGFQKLLAPIKKEYDKILTYADLNTGTGNVYEKSNFQLLNETTLNYWYADRNTRYNRFKYKATDEKTEKQVAQENNVEKIYGVGNKVFVLISNSH